MSALEKKRFYQRLFMLFLLLLATVLCFLWGSISGRYPLTVSEVIEAAFGGGSQQARLALFDMRFPRLVLAILVGIGMGMSGAMMQGLLRNDLASPGTLGVADGASLFVTAYMAFAPNAFNHPEALPFLALLGGLLAAAVVYALAVRKNRPLSTLKLVMTGVAVSAVYGSATTIAMYVGDESKLEFVQRWQAGELWGAEWPYIGILGLWLLVFAGLSLWKSRELNALQLGDEFASGLGLAVKRSFFLLSLVAIAMASSSVAFGGNFFFLGLIGPHIARRLVGRDSRILLPAAGLVSALLLLTASILVETLDLFANIPAGIVISLLSVPYFLYLIMKAG